MTSKRPKKDFEFFLKELDSIVEALEDGKLSLDDSLELFEKGMKNIRFCKNILQKTQQKVSILIEENGECASQDYKENEENF